MAKVNNKEIYEVKEWLNDTPQNRSGLSALVSGGGVTVEQLNVTENGTYTAEAGKAYSPVVVNVPSGSSATITFVGEEGLTLFGVIAQSYLTANSNTYTADNPEAFQTGVPKSITMLNSVNLYDIDCYSDEQTKIEGAVFEASGMAEITEEGITVRGDCTITVKVGQ